MKFHSLLIFVFLLVNLAAASAQTNCDDITQLQKVNQSEATADIWANSIGSTKSLRIKSKQLLKEAQSEIAPSKPPKDFCPDRCVMDPSPDVIFEVIPKAFLESSPDSELCNKLLEDTKKHPFEYSNRQFATMEDLSNWFSEFSQGNGKDGKDLYSRCTGACSPQYTSTIELNGNKLTLNASVLCGQPRTRSFVRN